VAPRGISIVEKCFELSRYDWKKDKSKALNFQNPSGKSVCQMTGIRLAGSTSLEKKSY